MLGFKVHNENNKLFGVVDHDLIKWTTQFEMKSSLLIHQIVHFITPREPITLNWNYHKETLDMNSNLQDFVRTTVDRMDNFDEKNLECIKEVVVEAIDFYKLKSFEEVEESQLGKIKFLHIHSIVEENLLSKIAEISMGLDQGYYIEDVYEGRVIREY